jgi:sulfofructose kinase
MTEADRRPILCVGALTCDLMLWTPTLPTTPGKHIATSAVTVAAGMAASAATAVARLGHPAALWASVGDDANGPFLVAEMAREGIDTRWIRTIPGAPSALAAILLAADGERIVVPHYAPTLLAPPTQVPPIDGGAFAAVMVDVRWPSAAAVALDAARLAGVPAILDLDTGPADVLADLARRATLVAASASGAAILTDTADPATAARRIAERTGATVMVTAGGDGVVLVTPDADSPVVVPAFPIRPVDTNAAGDVFHGALAVAIAEGRPPTSAIRFAAAAAAIKCGRPGGRLGAPTRAEVEALLAERPA